MALIDPLIRHNTIELKDEPMNVSFSFFTKKEAVINSASNENYPSSNTLPEPAKRGRPRKTKTLSNGDNVVLASEEAESLPLYQSNEPYIDTYRETNNMLKSSVMQIDQLNGGITHELEIIKASKTLKNKYNYISELTGTSSSLLGTKISAIREMNKIITDCHNLDMKRIKELNIGKDEGNDDQRIMDQYNAFISTPMGNYSPLGPSMIDITLPNGSMNNIVRTDISETGDTGFDNYVNYMTPEQNRMRQERNPNVKTVVMYNQETGGRSFDIIDMVTGQSIPNLTRPADFILEDLTINVRAGTARNSNIDTDYPLIVIGQQGSINDY